MDALAVKCYRLDGAEVQAARQCISRGGETIYVRPKTFQVLLYLLRHRERLVPKQELFDAIWADTAVSDSSLVQCIIDLRKALGDDSRNPRYIKTVPKAGYQFIGSAAEVGWNNADVAKPAGVEIEEYTHYEVEYEEDSDRELARPAPPRRAIRYVIAVLALMAIVGAVYAAWSYFGASAAARATLPHIDGRKPLAVMYFENQSGTAELDWLRAGLADILIADLSRSPSLTVLSRQELHLLMESRGTPDARPLGLDQALEIARSSRADILAMGSFAKFGESIRVNVQLHDGRSGRLLTAESVLSQSPDRLLSDVDLLSLRLARALGARTETDSGAASAPVMTDNLEAYRDYSMAVEKSQAYHTHEALALLEKAIALDPRFAMAQARIGYTYAVTWIFPDMARPYLEKAFALSSRLTELDRMYINAWYAIANRDYAAAVDRYRELIAAYPRETEAYVRLGHLLRGEERIGEAVATLEKGMQLDVPARKDIYNVLGGIYSQQGRHKEAIDLLQKLVALVPGEANAHDSLGLGYMWAGQFTDAEREYRKAMELDPAFDLPPLHVAILHFEMGRYRQAAAEFERQIPIAPSPLQRGAARLYLAEVRWRMGEPVPTEREAGLGANLGPAEGASAMQLALFRGDRARAESLVPLITRQPLHSHRGARPPYKRQEYYQLGGLALLKGENQKALEMFREAVRHWPGWADFSIRGDCLGDAYLQLGMWEEAIAEYNRVLKSFPGTALARFHLGVAYERSGRPQLARAEYARFLELWRNADADGKEVRAAHSYLAKIR